MKKIRLQGLVRKLNRLAPLSAFAAVAVAGTTASAQIVTNGFFQDNDSTFSSYAGYSDGLYGGPAFPDFTQTAPGGSSNFSAGINGYDIRYDRSASDSNEAETQFAPSGYSASTTTDPRDFAFIQSKGGTLYQDLSNLDPLGIYQVTFLEGERGSDTTNVGTVSVTGNGLTGASDSVTGQSAFTGGSFTFDTGLSTTGYILTLANTSTTVSASSGDSTTDFADVVITKIGTTPEPGTYALLGVGALGLLMAGRRVGRKA